LNAYAFVNFVGVLVLAVVLLAAGNTMGRGEVAMLVVLVLWGLLNVGGIFDHRRWALPSEIVRLPVTAVALAAELPDGPWRLPAGGGAAIAVTAAALWLLWHHNEFNRAARRSDYVTESPPERRSGHERGRAGTR
jgi:hypothetical protein